jgi:hypothetical protein
MCLLRIAPLDAGLEVLSGHVFFNTKPQGLKPLAESFCPFGAESDVASVDCSSPRTIHRRESEPWVAWMSPRHANRRIGAVSR